VALGEDRRGRLSVCGRHVDKEKSYRTRKLAQRRFGRDRASNDGEVIRRTPRRRWKK
jgi:hypothetical protein